MKQDLRYQWLEYLVSNLEIINGKVFDKQENEIKNARKFVLDLLREKGIIVSKSDLDFLIDSLFEYADNEKYWYKSKIVKDCEKLGKLPKETTLAFPLDPKQLTIINKLLFHPQEELLFISTGIGGSGKSTFLNIVKQLFENDYSSATLSDLSNEFMLAESIKHRLICSDELAKGDIDCRKIKQLVSKQPIQINPKHKTPYESKTQSALFFCCNKAPRIDITDTGILRRIIYYERNTKIKNPDITLKDKFYSYEELLTIARVAMNFESDLKEFEEETRYYLMKDNSVYSCDALTYESYVEQCRAKNLKPFSEPNWKEIKELFEKWKDEKIENTKNIFKGIVNVDL